MEIPHSCPDIDEVLYNAKQSINICEDFIDNFQRKKIEDIHVAFEDILNCLRNIEPHAESVRSINDELRTYASNLEDKCDEIIDSYKTRL